MEMFIFTDIGKMDGRFAPARVLNKPLNTFLEEGGKYGVTIASQRTPKFTGYARARWWYKVDPRVVPKWVRVVNNVKYVSTLNAGLSPGTRIKVTRKLQTWALAHGFEGAFPRAAQKVADAIYEKGMRPRNIFDTRRWPEWEFSLKRIRKLETLIKERIVRG